MRKIIDVLILLTFMLLYSCSNDDSNNSDLNKPIISDLNITELTSNSVRLNAFIFDDGGYPIITCGFRLSKTTTSSPDMSWGTNYSSTNEDFSVEIRNLEESTTYYYAAYASNHNGYTFTNILSFTTPKKSNLSFEPVVLYKPIVLSMDYSSSGFIGSKGGTYNYKMAYMAEIEVKGYEYLETAGFLIDGECWPLKELTEDGIYDINMAKLSNSSTINCNIKAYGKLKDGSHYYGNEEVISATYEENSGPSHKRVDVYNVRTEFYPDDYFIASVEIMANALKRNGILVHKDSSGYYWKDVKGAKHSVLPGITYNNRVYYFSQISSGRIVKTSKVYFSLFFTEF